MRIDLHTHSDRSDGTTPPRAVVAAAREAGLDVVALTDHDTAAGWEEAVEAAYDEGVALVRGMEISCKHHGRAAHLLAYLPDPTYGPLADELTRILAGRDERMPRIVAKLQDQGIPLDEELVMRHAPDAAALGRPHVADALVSMGVVADRDEAFDRLLSPGRPGYVTRYAPDLTTMLGVVRAAGGVPVLAHPWGRTDVTALQEPHLAALQEAGLLGLEVDHQDHDRAQRDRLRSIARNLGLLVTGSSDYHGAGKTDHELGCNLTVPEELARLEELAAEVARASGRKTPDVVRP